VISDVHANASALRAVLADIDARGVKRIICLGDTVGYGPDPLECVDLVRQRCAWSLMGNPDYGVLYEPTNFNPAAEIAAFWTREMFDLEPDEARRTERYKFLNQLKVRVAERIGPDGAEPVSTLNWLGAKKAAVGGDDGGEVEEAAPKQKAAFAPVAAADGGAKFAAAVAAQAAAGGVGGAEGDEDKADEGKGDATANPTQVSVDVETRWLEYHDKSNGDVWYVREGTEETDWTLPEGGVVVARHEA
jgi:hypothetical protein